MSCESAFSSGYQLFSNSKIQVQKQTRGTIYTNGRAFAKSMTSDLIRRHDVVTHGTDSSELQPRMKICGRMEL
jgi:hypothetical protein